MAKSFSVGSAKKRLQPNPFGFERAVWKHRNGEVG